MVSKKFRVIKLACYMSNVSMAIVGNIPPILFLTFHDSYGISYSALGFLVLLNFSTQLVVDLAFSFFSHRFNIPKIIKKTPLLTVIGILIYAIWPYIFPENVYIGFVLGTLIFSASSGFVEVLISPVIAALPSDEPEREMSKLHSSYAWGVVGVIILSSLYLLVFGSDNWQILMLTLSAIPLFSAFLFSRSQIPKMQTPKKISGIIQYLKSPTLWLCVAGIFFGGASECTMAQWASSYLELSFGIEKIWGDIFGVGLFAVMLGFGRTLYSKYGKNITRVLFLGSLGAIGCYLLCSMTSFAPLGLIACAMTGFCVSMLWPGSLIVASERIPSGGVFLYAMMAAGGDLGASIGPQMIGFVTDKVMSNELLCSFAERIGLMSEQFGMKTGMFLGTVFPIFAAVVFLYIKKTNRRVENNEN